MTALTAAQVAVITGGTMRGVSDAAVALNFTIDSRKVTPGIGFIALPGERADGAQFSQAAVLAGAPFVIAQRPVDGPSVLVADSVQALGQLGAHALATRRTLSTPFTSVAVTGSAGKTTTKDLLARLARSQGPTVAAKGSFNNHLGVPLTLLELDEVTRYLVLEMGANHVGEIAALTKLAPPDVAVELGVGVAHLGEFGSVEAIAQAKAELLAGLRPGGVAVLNLDEPLTRAMKAPGRVVGFGRAADAEIRLEAVDRSAGGGTRVKLATPKGQVTIASKLIGLHHATNLAAAVATGWALGLEPTELARALDGAGPASPHRMALRQGPEGSTLVDDAYNANPDSMRAALEAVEALAAGRPIWAILGAMLELGPTGERQHFLVGQAAAKAGVTRLTVVGQAAKAIMAGALDAGLAPEAVEFWPDADAARAAQGHGKEWIILIKGSHGSGLYRLADQLAEA